ncbi:MAG: zinc-ribbon domain-containing protein [Alphaproteobacteria bacterium]|nr:zinc-ribbon domain-containing protein [Alphaproteobacteria bacterium]
MLIICPKCFAKYEVDEHLLHDNVQIFQCTECQHRFEEHLELSTKNLSENASSMPTSFPSVVSDAVQNAAQNNETIPSSRDFIAERSVILPEAFTPIENTPQKGRKILLLAFILLFMLMVFGGMYLWVAKDIFLEQYPSLRKAVHLLNDKPVQSVIDDAELPMEEEGADTEQADSVNEQKLPTNEVIDLTKTDGVPTPERILPIETDTAEALVLGEVNVPKNETDMLEDVVELVEVPLENTSNNQDSVGQEIQKSIEDNGDVTGQNPQEQPVILTEEAVLKPNALKEPVSDETVEVIEDILMPADISGEVVSVQIKDVTFKNDMTDKTLSRMFVQGMIENTSGVAGVIPPLQAQLYDKDNVLLGVRDLPYAPTMIQPKSPEFFFYELSEVPTGSVAKVTVIVKGQ